MTANLIQLKRTSSVVVPIPVLQPGELAARVDDSQGFLYLGLDNSTAVRIGSGLPSYLHVQAVAALTWTIDHDLGYRPLIELVGVDDVVFEAEIEHTTLDQAIVTLTVATAGEARCQGDFLGSGTNSPTSLVWGSITGLVANQLDLQGELNAKADLASPSFTGIPEAPTAAPGTNTAQLATTAFVLANAGTPGDADYGDITVSGVGTVWSVDANAITNAQLDQMATKTYKGRTTVGTGDPEDVPVGTLKLDLNLVKADVGLGSVDDTSDVNKPVSFAQQIAIDGKVADAIVDGVTTVAPSQNAVFDALALTLAGNAPIVAGTNTKISYDTKGLVTSSTAATTADINDSLNRRYVTDAELVIIGNTTGTNTGDNAVNTNSNTYADGKVTQTITDGVLTTAPSEDAVFDALALKEDTANKGIAGGYCPLDGSNKIPVSYLPGSVFIYKGVWDASINTPTLADGTGVGGWLYRVSVAGTIDLGSGNITYAVGDYAIHNGTEWEKSDTTDSVTSVNSQTGSVVLTKTDIGLSNVDNTTDATKPVSGPQQLAIDAKVADAIVDGVTTVAPSQNAVFDALALKIGGNAAILSDTKTKITYDSKGLVVAGATAQLASADFANQGTASTVLHGNAGGNPTFGLVSLSGEVSGTLPVANGGTGQTSYTNGQLLIGNTTGGTLVPATLTQGAGTKITNGSGSITIAAAATITFSAAKNGNANISQYLQREADVDTNLSPFVMPFACTLTYVTARSDIAGASGAWTAGVYKNGVSASTLAVSANKATSGVLAVAFAAGDEVSFFFTHTGGNVKNPSINAIFREVL